MSKKSSHIGTDALSYLDSRLRSDSFRKKFEATRLKIALGMRARGIARNMRLSVRQLAKRMDSSASQVQRLLENKNVSIATLVKFAAATGRRLEIEFMEIAPRKAPRL